MVLKAQNYPGDLTRSYTFEPRLHGFFTDHQVGGDFSVDLPDGIEIGTPLKRLSDKLLAIPRLSNFMIFRPDGVTLSVPVGDSWEGLEEAVLEVLTDAMGESLEALINLPMMQEGGLHDQW